MKFNKNWNEYTLYDLAVWKNGLAFKDINFSKSGIPIIKIAELKNGLTAQTKYTNNSYSDEVLLKKDDLVFSWSGNPKTSIDAFLYDLPEGYLNQHSFKVTANENIILKHFLYYILKYLNPLFQDIASNKQTTGLGHVTISDLKRIKVNIPNIENQEKFLRIVKIIDSKINNNTQINDNLVEYTGRFLDQKKYEEIGFLITDIELITVLWLKSFKTNPDLPKMKLIENARATLELTTTMMKRVKDVLEKMEREGTINQADIVSSNIQELNYYRKEIMERIDGDEVNINEETILGIIDKENIKLKQEIIEERELNKKIIEENEEAKKEKVNMKESIEKKCKDKAKKIITNLKNTYIILNYTILFIVLIIIIYIMVKNEWTTKITLYLVIGGIIEILGIIDCFVPKFGKVKKFILGKISNFEEPLYLHLVKKKKEEFPNLF